MVTLVGTQNDFDDAINALIELEYDAIGAYKLAIEKLEDTTYKAKLTEFLHDHERHVTDLTSCVILEQNEPPRSGDFVKGLMAKTKVMVGNLTGSDLNILRAMLDNEMDTNKAYERMVDHPQKPLDLELILKRAYDDEVRHKAWLEDTISKAS